MATKFVWRAEALWEGGYWDSEKNRNYDVIATTFLEAEKRARILLKKEDHCFKLTGLKRSVSISA